jgi:hypothetical protein
VDLISVIPVGSLEVGLITNQAGLLNDPKSSHPVCLGNITVSLRVRLIIQSSLLTIWATFGSSA